MYDDCNPISILIAEDDPDDQMLTQEALADNRLVNDVRFVNDGEELLDYLYGRGRYSSPPPRPDLILLDLNMPKRDGRQALSLIKADDELRLIPIVVLTTSRAEEDVLRTYQLGVNSFIVKPVTFESLVQVTRVLTEYWFSIVRLPPH
jgi:CheY-like chemotaxis protein